MRILIIKTSSMGDVIHTLPALTDAGKAIPGITFDWVVEESFAEIPRWHPLVDKIIPIAWRRWRKQLLTKQTLRELIAFRKNLQEQQYDLVIDAQGLVKSALVTWFAKGLRCGANKQSARESLAALFYQRAYPVEFQQHAVTRNRTLLSQVLGYSLPTTMADYGINKNIFLTQPPEQEPYLLFLHGTTWATKHWPETYWIALTKLANEAGFLVKLPWGNTAEQERAYRIAASSDKTQVLPRLTLADIATVLAGAKAVVAVDTGLGHLAAALDVPTVSLYGPTNPILTGALGKSQIHLSATFSCAPCLSKTCTYVSNQPSPLYPPCFAATLQPTTVWQALLGQL
jgi:heptosyltransferase-1